jgi:hypothetical protein
MARPDMVFNDDISIKQKSGQLSVLLVHQRGAYYHIMSFGDIPYPARSPVLKVPDLFLVGYFKSNI